MFNCEFDKEYLGSAIKIGAIHHKHKVAPHLYPAGYNFFHCELIRIAAVEYKGVELPAVLGSILRVKLKSK